MARSVKELEITIEEYGFIDGVWLSAIIFSYVPDWHAHADNNSFNDADRDDEIVSRWPNPNKTDLILAALLVLREPYQTSSTSTSQNLCYSASAIIDLLKYLQQFKANPQSTNIRQKLQIASCACGRWTRRSIGMLWSWCDYFGSAH